MGLNSMDYYGIKYREYNKEFFKNRLPNDVDIKIRRFTKRFGTIYIYARYKDGVVTRIPNKPFAQILLGLVETEARQLLTLKHEMCHLYCFIRGKQVGHTEYFWKLLKAIGGAPTLGYKTAEIVFAEKYQERKEEVSRMSKETNEVKKTPGTVLLAEKLQSGAYTVEQLAEMCGVSINTVKVQISFHLKQKGYIIDKVQEGEVTKYRITGKGPELPKKPKKVKPEVVEEA